MEEKAKDTVASKVDGDQPLPRAASPQPPKPHSPSPLLWFGIGLLVVVLGGGYYVLSNKTGRVVPSPTPAKSLTTSPTTDPTDNWLGSR